MKKRLGVQKITLKNLDEQQLQQVNGGATTKTTCASTCAATCTHTCADTCRTCGTCCKPCCMVE